MTPTDTDNNPTLRRAVREVLAAYAWVARGAAKAVRRRGHDVTQGLGAVATLAGVYTSLGLSATLIIGGVSTLIVSTLREGERI